MLFCGFCHALAHFIMDIKRIAGCVWGWVRGGGGGHIFHQVFVFAGSDVFHCPLVVGGGPDPPISQMILPTISNIQQQKNK